MPDSASQGGSLGTPDTTDALSAHSKTVQAAVDKGIKAEAARRAAGLAGSTNSLNVALKAMNEAAARDLAQAEAASLKAKLLAPTRPEQDDPNIAAALAAASGKGPAPQSASDRLARLKARHG